MRRDEVVKSQPHFPSPIPPPPPASKIKKPPCMMMVSAKIACGFPHSLARSSSRNGGRKFRLERFGVEMLGSGARAKGEREIPQGSNKQASPYPAPLANALNDNLQTRY